MSESDFGTEEVLEAPESQELKPTWPGAPRFCMTRSLPEYRFVITYGSPRGNVQWSDLAAAFSLDGGT